MTEETTEQTEAQAPAAEEQEQTSPVDSGYAYKGDEYDQKIEQLLSAHEQQQKQSTETTEQTEERRALKLEDGESWDSIFDSQPPEVQRAMSSLRGDYTRKTQELAAQRKELEQQQRSLLDNEVVQGLQEIAEAEGAEFDPFDPESFSTYVNKIVAQKLQALLAPIQEQQETAAAETKVQLFMNEHPDLKEDKGLRKEVKNLLLQNESLDLKQAYWIAVGQRSRAAAAINEEEQRRQKAAKRQSAQLVSTGARRNASTVSPDIKQLKAWEIYEQLKSSRV